MCATGIVPALHGAPLRDRDGAAVGTVEALLSDPTTHRPAWLIVRLHDGRRTVVPARGAHPTPAGMRIRHPYDAVRTCPVTLADAGSLGREHLVPVCRHYGVAVPLGVAVHATAPPVPATAAA
jgi:hypothetical protein